MVGVDCTVAALGALRATDRAWRPRSAEHPQSAGGARPRARMGGAAAGSRCRQGRSEAPRAAAAVISQQERDRLLALEPNLVAVWQAATTPRPRAMRPKGAAAHPYRRG